MRSSTEGGGVLHVQYVSQSLLQGADLSLEVVVSALLLVSGMFMILFERTFSDSIFQRQSRAPLISLVPTVVCCEPLPVHGKLESCNIPAASSSFQGIWREEQRGAGLLLVWEPLSAVSQYPRSSLCVQPPVRCPPLLPQESRSGTPSSGPHVKNLLGSWAFSEDLYSWNSCQKR